MPLDVLQVTMRDLVGQRFNGHLLHRSLQALGHRSNMLVVKKRSADPLVHSHTAIGEWFERGLYAAERMSSLQGMLSPLALTIPWRRCFRQADVVHWHLIYPHYIALPLMPLLARLRPTIWTLHDPWAMTGHCVHPLECERWRTGCGKCPDLRRNFTVWFDTTALVWDLKRVVYRQTPMTLVVGSRWMKQRVEASPLLSSLPCHVIPFGLDLDVWRVLDRRECRRRLGIPAEANVIAFRIPLGIKHRDAKGIPWLIEALQRLEVTKPTYLLVLEDRGRLKELGDKYRIVELGWLDDESALVGALSAADVFVMPSRAESFGLMALEAMACGTAVITTHGTAVADTIHAPEAGLAVPAGDAGALAEALALLLRDPGLRRAKGLAGRRIVESEHSHHTYVRRHLELYQELARDRAGAGAGSG